ncbi:PiggyBac transposable element-derived protein 3 [Pseudolycoriella hygida]|uniref:PiggyBac transposable element-derived protein 3 n=1 Tax=Pseudolycoriella hygida TaxID=35572 RepID=A0A9Q0S9X5_9DIPT|nr:PiggyBac transposable element-derived protein 3 [Pseudolycoriella hygida]
MSLETTDDEFDTEESVIPQKILKLSAEVKASRAEKDIRKKTVKRKSEKFEKLVIPAKKIKKSKNFNNSVNNNCDNFPSVNCDKENISPVITKNVNSAVAIDAKLKAQPPKTKKIIKATQEKKTNKNNDNQSSSKGPKGKSDLIKWTMGGETIGEKEFGFIETRIEHQNMTATDYYELFFDDTLLDLIIFESTQYCISKNWPDIQLTKEELRTFFAILIVSGYNPLPSKAMYWNRGEDLRNEAVYKAMRRDRFDNIMKSLHFASESNLDQSDKYSKLRPIIEHLQKKFMKHFSPSEAIAHDEAMVEYFGRHGCKQAIRDKPIRFGYKIFCHNTPSGYLVAFDPYQGKTYQGDEDMEKEFGKAASSLLHLLDSYPLAKSLHRYHFYCDNYFTSLLLCKELKNRGYNCTGTIRANRLGGTCPLTDVKKLASTQRGYTEVATAEISGHKILLNRWKDNSVVTVASTLFAANPEGSVKRWSKTDKKKISVPIPHAIYNYNRNMGGTDRTNQNVNAYRISIRGKKWWWCLFTWMVDASVQNAWQLARKSNANLNQLQFRRDVALSYLSACSQPPKTPGRKPKISIENQPTRFDKIGHFVRVTGTKKQRRCRGNNCKSKVEV